MAFDRIQHNFPEWLQSGRFGTSPERVKFRTASSAECSAIIKLRGITRTVQDLVVCCNQTSAPFRQHPSSFYSLLKSIIWTMEILHSNGVFGLDFRPHQVFSSPVGIVLRKRIDTEINEMMLRNDSREAVRFLLYCAPEVMRGVENEKTVLKQADIWSFGCLSLYVLSEQDPQYYVVDVEGKRRLLNAHKNPVTSITILVGNGNLSPEHDQHCEKNSSLDKLFSSCFMLNPGQRITCESLSNWMELNHEHRVTIPATTGETKGYHQSVADPGKGIALGMMVHDPGTFVISIDEKNHYFRYVRQLSYKVAVAREFNVSKSSEEDDNNEVILKTVEYELPTNGAKRLEAITVLKESWERMCKLSHANVLACTYAVLEKITGFTQRFLTGTQIMKYSPIGNLQEFMKRSPILPIEKIKHFSYQLLCGIEYLHSQFSIIHGDIKPQNIILFPGTTMKFAVCLRITDFDHHVALIASVQHTEHGEQLVGTRRYMSPEMMLQETVGLRTDIWSFGCVLLEMLSGNGVFTFAYHETGFSDPFDPSLINKPFQTINEMDYRWGKGNAVPYVPPSITDPDCQNFLKACLTVDVQKRASAQILLSHPWMTSEISGEDIEEASIIFLQRQENWLQERGNAGLKRQWMQGIHCAGKLLSHLLPSEYDRPTFESMRQSVLKLLRTRQLGDDHLRMCVQHLESRLPALPEAERRKLQMTIAILQSTRSAYDIVNQLLPLVLSMETLADCMNISGRSTDNQPTFTVLTHLVWKDVKCVLQRKTPFICQITSNETNKYVDVVDPAKLVAPEDNDIGPLQLSELEFVIVNGYKMTTKGETLVSIIKASGEEITKTLSDFEAVWNWKVSDSLMQDYLTLERVLPASALY